MILDEATSALDPESEALINANLQRMARGRTMVIVSHRLSSLVNCDQILVLDRGQVVDLGPHHKLVERCAVYRHLWLQQIRHIDPMEAIHALLLRSSPNAVDDEPGGSGPLPLAALEFESPSAAIIATPVPPLSRATIFSSSCWSSRCSSPAD